jgi:probable F420-dependent oxidoreductase
MEFGFGLPQSGRHASSQALTHAAQEAERSGYAAVWVLERLLRPLHPRAEAGRPAVRMPESYATVYDPIETLTYVAAKTTRIKLGTSVIDALFHVPVVLARWLATLDHFSSGRVIAGLGQGYAPEEFETANVPMKRWGAGFEEFIRALRAAWGPDPVRFSGRFYHIAESQIGPKPLQPGGPPLFIAAMEPAAVERAGRLGDGFNPQAASWEKLEQAVTGFRNAARAVGRNPDVLPIVVRTTPAVSAQPLAEPRPPLSGAHEQVRDDLLRLRSIGVTHVFFDMTRFDIPLDEQFRLGERLRKAVT